MSYTVKNIVYVPSTDIIQALVSFLYNEKLEHTVINYSTIDYPTLTLDVKALQLTSTFIELVEESIIDRKNIIDNPQY